MVRSNFSLQQKFLRYLSMSFFLSLGFRDVLLHGRLAVRVSMGGGSKDKIDSHRVGMLVFVVFLSGVSSSALRRTDK
jgi:hypothetical protein